MQDKIPVDSSVFLLVEGITAQTAICIQLVNLVRV